MTSKNEALLTGKLVASQAALEDATKCRSLYEVQQILKIRIEDLEKELAS